MNNENRDNTIELRSLAKDLLTYIDEAKAMAEHELCLKGDYKNNPTLRYPQTKAEYIADGISTLLTSSDLVDGEKEPLLDEILSLASQLDTNVNQPKVWQDLFELAGELKNEKLS